MPNVLLTCDQIAEEIGVQPSTIRTWVREGKIPALRITGKVVRFDRDDVIAALKKGAETEKKRK